MPYNFFNPESAMYKMCNEYFADSPLKNCSNQVIHFTVVKMKPKSTGKAKTEQME